MKYLFLLAFLLLKFISFSQTLQGSFESKFKRYQKSETFTGNINQTWDVVAWKGERIHKQMVLWTNETINGLGYNISNLVNGGYQVDQSNISLRFGTYIKGDPKAKSCSEYPTHPSFVEIADALSEDVVRSIDSTDPLKIWLTIDVPKVTVPGTYTGTITVTGASSPLVFNISLQVVNYTLPDVEDWSFHLDIWQFPVNILNIYNAAHSDNPVAMWSDEHLALLEPGYKLLANTGQKAITAYIKDGALGGESMIKWTKKTDGTWVYDFTAFDKYVSTLMSWGITKQIDCFSPVGWNETIIPYFDEVSGAMKNLSASLGSLEYQTRWDHFLTAFKAFLDAKDWFDKTVLYLDEVEESKLLNVVSAVHGHNSNWKLGIAYSHSLSNASKANFYDLSGILEDASNTGISTDKISTFYTSCTQTNPNNYVTPENSPAEMTWMGWHAFKEDYDGYLRWAFDYWSLTDPFDARDGPHTAGDFSMIYRASNLNPSEILSSIRFEMLRNGIQDYEKLKIVRASLEGASHPYERDQLNKLNAIIGDFGKTSGLRAEQLVIRGQQALKNIALGTFGYCKVNGGVDKGCYIKSLTSAGGVQNINFNAGQYPDTGYDYHTSSKVSILPGETFTLNLENSALSNCARVKVWIDWNNDEDFQDTGEMVFSGGVAGSCNNAISYSIPVTVPSNISQDVKRMRIQVRDALEPEPVTCGTNNKTSTIDFDIEILDSYCSITGSGDYNANTVITTNGHINIHYSGVNGVDNYSLSEEKIAISQSGTFDLSVTNSNGWSRSIVWIDWNGDDDFDDLGERLTPLSPEKVVEGTTPTYTLSVTVPDDATLGIHKMRIVTGDAWTYEDLAIPDTPCGILTPHGTFENASIKDFSIEILPSLGLETIEDEDILVYPNPVKTRLYLNAGQLNNLNVKSSITNTTGQIIYQKNLSLFQSPEEIILPNGLKNGLYFLKLCTRNRSYIHKLIIS
ncbi:glycoside hydrolase domain-containing protein [Tamlana sp. 2201CG12-4]|uniref:glycoside hydrolase domain-containing protein n=1 Tax=Tamlana sp. 2201CG12-4 TaxID=3112582 RepID=UPI002DBC9CA8|nr:glycoside hydrolase domain-containing protein [Tamlana sp. 2201CG12-4]MEC3905529.1 glycoside hydrolase domain-containing protein [Tamlana sp. 2201CG12-4]